MKLSIGAVNVIFAVASIGCSGLYVGLAENEMKDSIDGPPFVDAPNGPLAVEAPGSEKAHDTLRASAPIEAGVVDAGPDSRLDAGQGCPGRLCLGFDQGYDVNLNVLNNGGRLFLKDVPGGKVLVSSTASASSGTYRAGRIELAVPTSASRVSASFDIKRCATAPTNRSPYTFRSFAQINCVANGDSSGLWLDNTPDGLRLIAKSQSNPTVNFELDGKWTTGWHHFSLKWVTTGAREMSVMMDGAVVGLATAVSGCANASRFTVNIGHAVTESSACETEYDNVVVDYD